MPAAISTSQLSSPSEATKSILRSTKMTPIQVKILSHLLLQLVAFVAIVKGQSPQQASGVISQIPGGQTAAGVLAASADGASRYFAPDGPIQPGVTAIGGLPMRGAEILNQGISRISSGFNSGAQSLSSYAGHPGNVDMPGMQALESSMPASIAQVRDTLQNTIKSKNNWIRGQAEAGVQAGERLRSMMTNGFQGMTSRSGGKGMMQSAADAMEHMQGTMMKGASTMQNQLKQSLSGHLDRLSSLQGIGQNMQGQMRGIGQTLQSGLTSTVEQLHKTGEQLRGQRDGGMKKNVQMMSGMVGSMQGSMMNMGQNVDSNLKGLAKHAQHAAQMVTEQLQEAVKAPINMLSSLGSMMPKGGPGSSSGGRY